MLVLNQTRNLSLCMLLALASAAAIDVDYSSSRICAAEPAMDRAISNETILAEVTRWSHGKLRDWRYEPVGADAAAVMVRGVGLSAAEASGAKCVAVAYVSLLEIPQPLKGLLELLRVSVDVEVKIKKRVCRAGHVLVEDAEIEAPIVDNTRLLTRMTATENVLASNSTMHMRMPWWASVLEAEVASAMRRLVDEKFDAVKSVLCEAPANQRKLLGTGPRGGFMRRALDRPGGFTKQHPLKPVEPKPALPKVDQNATETLQPLDANATGGLLAFIVEELLVVPMAAAKAAAEAEKADQDAAAEKKAAQDAAAPEAANGEAPPQKAHARPPSHIAELVARRGAHARTHFLMRRRNLSERTLSNARVY